MIVRLQSGSLAPQIVAETSDYLDKEALLVYQGGFESAEGHVDVSDADIERTAARYNARMSKKMQAAGGQILPDFCPPIQLDHSPSATVTIGRLWGPVRVGTILMDVSEDDQPSKLESRKALFGLVRVLGPENMVKVKDGRWVHGSIGADFEEGEINEWTVTPFPAAKNARMLSKVRLTQLSKGEPMDKEKLKAHLMEKEKLSAEDAEKKLAALTDEESAKLAAECDEKEKKLAADKEADEKRLAAEKEEADKKEADEKAKLAAEAEEKEKDEKEKKDKELSARKASFVQLAKGIRTGVKTGAQLKRKADLRIRLSALRADRKITPAELKGVSVDQLSAKSDEAIEAFFDGFKLRQPVIFAGQYSSHQATSLARVSSEVELSKLEAETRANMPFTGKGAKLSGAEKSATELAGKKKLESDEGSDEELESYYGNVCKMMEEGKKDDAFKALREFMSKHFAKRMAGEMDQDSQKELSALAENNKTLHNQFEELVNLVSPVLGVESSDLN